MYPTIEAEMRRMRVVKWPSSVDKEEPTGYTLIIEWFASGRVKRKYHFQMCVEEFEELKKSINNA